MNLKYGIITEVDATKGLARVRFDADENLVSYWLPMVQSKTLVDKFMIFYDINEHVAVLMDSNCEEGIIIGALYSENTLPDGGEEKKVRVKFAGNLSVEYDRQTSSLNVNGTGLININVSGKVTVQSTTEVDVIAPLVKLTAANVEASGIITAAAITTTAGGNITIGSGAKLIVENIEAATDVKIAGLSLKTHKHLGVTTGGGTSGLPTP